MNKEKETVAECGGVPKPADQVGGKWVCVGGQWVWDES